MSGRPANLFYVIPRPTDLAEPVLVVECGCGGCFHRFAYDGDCRNNSECFGDLQAAANIMGKTVVEAWDADDAGGPTTRPFEYYPEPKN